MGEPLALVPLVRSLALPERLRETLTLAWLAYEGPGGLYVVCGPPGSGKSAVFETLVAPAVECARSGRALPFVAVAHCARPESAPAALCKALDAAVPFCACPVAGGCRTAREIAAHARQAEAAGTLAANRALRLVLFVDGGSQLAANDSWAGLAALQRLLGGGPRAAVCSVLVAARECPAAFAALHGPTVVPLEPYTRAQCVAIAARLLAAAFAGTGDLLSEHDEAATFVGLLASLFLSEEAPVVRTLLRLALQHEELYRTCVQNARAAATATTPTAAKNNGLRPRDPMLEARARFADACARQHAVGREKDTLSLLGMMPVKVKHTLIACYLAAHTKPSQDFAFERAPEPPSQAARGKGKKGSKATKPQRRSTSLKLVAMRAQACHFALRRAAFIQQHLFGNTAVCATVDADGEADRSLSESARIFVQEDEAALFDFFAAVRELARVALVRMVPCATVAQQLVVAGTLSQHYECTASRMLVHTAAVSLDPPLFLEEFVSPAAT